MADTPKLDAPFEAQFHNGRMQEYIIGRLIRQIHTATLVKVLAVYPTAGAVGFVDVQPLVQQQTTNAVLLPQSPMFRLPYLRVQGGASAVILDPAVDDLGLAVFAERDITAAISARGEAPPATNRAYDAGDGLYLGGFLNADPTQWLKFLPDAGGIELVTPGNLTIRTDGDMTAQIGGDLSVTVAGTVNVAATSTTWSGPVTFTDPITAPQATIGGIAFTSHKHGGVQTGSGTSGTPVP